MTDRIIEIEFGPYVTEYGTYLVALVEDMNGNRYSDEIYYDSLDDCYADIEDLLEFGAVELEEDELDQEGDEDHG